MTALTSHHNLFADIVSIDIEPNAFHRPLAGLHSSVFAAYGRELFIRQFGNAEDKELHQTWKSPFIADRCTFAQLVNREDRRPYESIVSREYRNRLVVGGKNIDRRIVGEALYGQGYERMRRQVDRGFIIEIFENKALREASAS
ncbi:hypothetical protein [Subtercola vilae]|uniref:Uncharacterized protein n=1 Tax=Subtercola vilae TaxID=2056433 RepID=A0A4T2C7R6_9MICO|nr:hypothetical protein [Subtercola vilae]TIH40180.1 hypothetical protein D4765_03440 [Subtercola vilae]